MPSPARRTLFWKYAAYFSGLVSALLILSGGLGGYFAYRESAAALEALQRAKAQVAASEIASFIGRLVDDLQSVTTKFSSTGAVDEEDLRVELVALSTHAFERLAQRDDLCALRFQRQRQCMRGIA